MFHCWGLSHTSHLWFPANKCHELPHKYPKYSLEAILSPLRTTTNFTICILWNPFSWCQSGRREGTKEGRKERKRGWIKWNWGLTHKKDQVILMRVLSTADWWRQKLDFSELRRWKRDWKSKDTVFPYVSTLPCVVLCINYILVNQESVLEFQRWKEVLLLYRRRD